MKILVCGNQKFTDRDFIFSVLQKLEFERQDITLMMQFGDGGPAEQARSFAWEIGDPSKPDDLMASRIKLKTYHHDWDRYAMAAPRRSYAKVLAEDRPDLVLIFGPERGHDRMFARDCIAAQIEVLAFAVTDLDAMKVIRAEPRPPLDDPKRAERGERIDKILAGRPAQALVANVA